MSPKNDAISQIGQQLQMIEDGTVTPYAGFKQICWIADVYMVWFELCGVVPGNNQTPQEQIHEQGL